MTYSEILSKVALETGLSKTLVDKTYRAYWRAVREHIVSLPLKEELTESEFCSLRPNINIPSIGKLNVTLDRFRTIINFRNEIKKRKESENAAYKEDKAPVHLNSDNRRQV